MASTFRERLIGAWNAFINQDPVAFYGASAGAYSSSNPGRQRLNASSEKTIIASIYTRIAIDATDPAMKHVRLDPLKRYSSDVDSGLNQVLTLRANKDQSGSAFRQDAVMTMLDKGVIALVPIDTDDDPTDKEAVDILTMRVGEVVAWFPDQVRLSVFDDRTNLRREITLPKSAVAIIENPLYSVMNEPNSTMQRLIRKLNLLDAIDQQSGSGKLDIIIQLPYVIKTEQRRLEAEKRRKDIEDQLAGSRYGIAYADATEHITQLNRPAENNLLKQVQYLTDMLYSQLGITPEVMLGKATAEQMANYYRRTINPILRALAENIKWSFLTKTARTQGQSIEFYRDPFATVSSQGLAQLVDVLSRNEIVTANEVRGVFGFMPSTEDKADMLVNSNMPQNQTDRSDPSYTDSVDVGALPASSLSEN